MCSPRFITIHMLESESNEEEIVELTLNVAHIQSIGPREKGSHPRCKAIIVLAPGHVIGVLEDYADILNMLEDAGR